MTITQSCRGILAGFLMLLPIAQAAAPAPGKAASKPASKAETAMNPIAEQYVKLVLALGVHDSGYVDAYHGPAEWKTAVAAEKLPLDEIRKRERAARAALARIRIAGAEEMLRLRHAFLDQQLASMEVRLDLLDGRQVPFDTESRLLYGAVAPQVSDAEIDVIASELEHALPGAGSLSARLSAFRQEYVVSVERLPAVMKAAIAEARRRTREHIALPDSEGFTFELVSGNPWSAYNWFKGDFQSLIQVETTKPVYISRILDLACHEGYPGHHVANLLLEDRLQRGRGWIEFSVYPLYSPLSLIAEGSGNYAIDVVFPPADKAKFEREVLYPLAGIDPSKADALDRITRALKKSRRAENEISRRLIDGKITTAQAQALLIKLGKAPVEAIASVRFTQHYRSYVVNYSVGEDLVRAYIEKRAGTDPTRRWKEFERLIASPRLPSGIR